MLFQPPIQHTPLLGWFSREITHWVIVGFTAVAVVSFSDHSYLLVGLGIAGALLVYGACHQFNQRKEHGAGLYYCKKCQYYKNPEAN
jgi:hypothetical protein